MFQFLTIATLIISATSAYQYGYGPELTKSNIVAEIQDAPYVASLYFDGQLTCGAVIINEYFVLTAAACLKSNKPEFYQIRAGTLAHNYGGTLHKVKLLIRHENFVINRFNVPVNDIALVQVENKFFFDGKRDAIPIYPNKYLVTGSDAKFFGWGRIESTFPAQLRKGDVEISNTLDCKHHFAGRLPEGQICAQLSKKSSNLKVPCERDAGGPLVVGVHLVGIISWGKSCEIDQSPHAYTFVSSYRLWIDTNVKNNYPTY